MVNLAGAALSFFRVLETCLNYIPGPQNVAPTNELRKSRLALRGWPRHFPEISTNQKFYEVRRFDMCNPTR
jgi:hypothetical protein